MPIALYTSREFMAAELESPPALISPWLASGSIALLFGAPSAGKSMISTTIAHAVANGLSDLFGKFACVQANVLVVQADMPTALYQERLRAAESVLPTNLLLWLTDSMPLDVLRMSGHDSLLAETRAYGPKLIVVDTLRKTHDLDENESTAPDRVYAAWRRLFPEAAFLFLHHSRKLPALGTSPDTVIREAFRGSSAWAASADTILMARRVRKANNPDWLVKVHFVRTRSCEEPKPILLRRTDQLFVEPATLPNASEQALRAWLAEHTEAPRSEAIHWLQTQNIARRTAYRLYDRVFEQITESQNRVENSVEK